MSEQNKVCSHCRILKPFNDFANNRSTYDGKQGQCKECHKQSLTNSYRKYREQRIANQMKYNKNRYHTDESYRIQCLLRTRLHNALNNQSAHTVHVPTLELIGCTIAFLRCWLEYTKKFYVPQEYTDTLHIDHFIPISSFNLNDPEQQKQSMHWSNLRYLTAEENHIKSNKQPTLQECIYFNSIVQMFLCQNLNTPHNQIPQRIQ